MSRFFGEVPPEIDRLRRAREVVNPGQVYRLELPDGTLFTTTGAELIATSDAFVALGDAVRARDDLAVLRALDRLGLTPPNHVSS